MDRTLVNVDEPSFNSNEPGDSILAIYGSTIVVGKKQGRYTRAVYVMEVLDRGESTSTQVVHSPDDVNGGWNMFGFSVDIFKDRLIVGEPFANADDSGAAYIYARTDEGSWELEFIFPPPEQDDSTSFGDSVAKYKDRAAVLGYNEFDEVTVFIYEYDKISDSWEKLNDVILDKPCPNCKDVGISVSFRNDGHLFITYYSRKEIWYLVPTSFDNGGEYELVQKIVFHEDRNVYSLDQVEVGGVLMVVVATDEFDTNLVYVYSQSDMDDSWIKVDEINLLGRTQDGIVDLALSKNNLIVNYGDTKLLWYAINGC
jgi:hypothetical protein